MKLACFAVVVCALQVGAIERYVAKSNQLQAYDANLKGPQGTTNYIQGFNNQDDMYKGPSFPAPVPPATSTEVSNSLQEPFSDAELAEGKERHNNELTLIRQRKAKACTDCGNKPANNAEKPNSEAWHVSIHFIHGHMSLCYPYVLKFTGYTSGADAKLTQCRGRVGVA